MGFSQGSKRHNKSGFFNEYGEGFYPGDSYLGGLYPRGITGGLISWRDLYPGALYPVWLIIECMFLFKNRWVPNRWGAYS